jgi:hypothetical protein
MRPGKNTATRCAVGVGEGPLAMVGHVLAASSPLDVPSPVNA